MSNTDTELDQLLDEWAEELIGWNYGTVYKLYDTEETADTLEADTKERVTALKAKLEALIQARDTAHKNRLLEAVGENETPGKRGTEEYTRKYVVDIRNHFRAELHQAINEIYGGQDEA